jgi:hypothetical protein
VDGIVKDWRADLVVLGAGAAGLMAAIQAKQERPSLDLLLVEGRPRPGAKLLVSGGGRCNLTNRQIRPGDFNSASPRQVARVLKAFPLTATLDFFTALGLTIAQEEHGRLYPASRRAAHVLEALLAATHRLGIRWLMGSRVTHVRPEGTVWCLEGEGFRIQSRRVILAMGGCSLPRSGSDGAGLRLAARLGLRLTEPIVPALASLTLPDGHVLRSLAGVATPVSLRLEHEKRRWRGELLFTHFGCSGPAVLDASRHVLAARARGRGTRLLVDWLPEMAEDRLHQVLAAPGGRGRAVARLQEWLPERLAQTLVELAGLTRDGGLAQLDRGRRVRLVDCLKNLELPVIGARSWHHAETTAGGVSLDELEATTLEARPRPGLHLCGELCDVDGRLGGFNFQWAWSSGAVAGRGAARLLDQQRVDQIA